MVSSRRNKTNIFIDTAIKTSKKDLNKTRILNKKVEQEMYN